MPTTVRRGVKLGWGVWCLSEDCFEPEGIVFFDWDDPPKVGGGMILCDGGLWQIVEVVKRTCTVVVKQPSIWEYDNVLVHC